LENATKLFIDEQLNWNDTVQMSRFYDISLRFSPEQTPLERDPIMYIFLQGTQGISKKETIEKITGRPTRHPYQVLIIFLCD
jgi:hypothetical protein